MYAVIKTGGKQYKVAKDQIVVVEKLAGEAGATVAFEEVLMVGQGEDATVGAPLVAGATVTAEIVEQGRGSKIVVFKRKRRKNYRRCSGHRQHQTVLRITDISTGGKTAAKAKTDEAKEAPKAVAKPKAAAKPKAKAESKAKAETKPKAAPKKKAEPKAKSETKAKASAKKADPKAKSGTKAKAPAKKTGDKKAPAKKTEE
jgi:large subunit ribosomal protein L21